MTNIATWKVSIARTDNIKYKDGNKMDMLMNIFTFAITVISNDTTQYINSAIAITTVTGISATATAAEATAATITNKLGES